MVRHCTPINQTQMASRHGAARSPRSARTVRAAGLVLAALGTFAAPTYGAGEAIAYQNAFLDPAGSEWNPARTMSSPNGEQFLGPFHNERVMLSLNDIPQHDMMVVAFDLYVRGDWQGDGGNGLPPSTFMVTIDGQQTMVNATIATDDGTGQRTQSFPDEVGKKRYDAGWGSFQANALGFMDPSGTKGDDTTYRVVLAMRHSGTNVNVEIGVNGLHDPSIASWGVDNVAIEVSSSEEWPDLGVIGPTLLDGLDNPFGQGGVGTNPPKPGLAPPGGVEDGGDPPPDPETPETPPVPAPGAVVVGLLSGAMGLRRRRRAA